MSFGDVKTPAGLEQLNSFLATRSYVSGYAPSSADSQVWEQVGGAPGATAPHARRWYAHIASYSATERKAWPAGVTPLTAGGKPTTPAPPAKPTTPAAAAATKADDDDDVDLFGSGDEEEDAEAARVREERLQAYASKKSNKPALIAKSSIVLDVKPWDDETDMGAMEERVRSIHKDGLVWGASKLVPVGYGINKLQIMCVVEDDKVSIDELSEQIQEFEDFVQSVDVAAFNKI